MTRDKQGLIAGAQVVGGILVIAGYALFPLTGLYFDPAWQVVPPMAFGLMSMMAGIALFRQSRWAIPFSIVVQVLQLFSVSYPGHFRYVAFAGPLAQLICSTTGVRLNFGAGGAFAAFARSPDGTLGAPGVALQTGFGIQPGPMADSTLTIALNFVAIYFIYHLVDIVVERRKQAIQSVNAVATEST